MSSQGADPDDILEQIRQREAEEKHQQDVAEKKRQRDLYIKRMDSAVKSGAFTVLTRLTGYMRKNQLRTKEAFEQIDLNADGVLSQTELLHSRRWPSWRRSSGTWPRLVLARSPQCRPPP